MIKVIVEVREIEGAIATEVYSEGGDSATQVECVAAAPFFIAAERLLKMIHRECDGSSQLEGEDTEGYRAARRAVEEKFKQRKKNNDPSNPNPN